MNYSGLVSVIRQKSYCRPLARSLALLTHSLAPHCSFFLRALLRSFVYSLTYSRSRGKMYDSMCPNDLVVSHSAMRKRRCHQPISSQHDLDDQRRKRSVTLTLLPSSFTTLLPYFFISSGNFFFCLFAPTCHVSSA